MATVSRSGEGCAHERSTSPHAPAAPGRGRSLGAARVSWTLILEVKLVPSTSDDRRQRHDGGIARRGFFPAPQRAVHGARPRPVPGFLARVMARPSRRPARRANSPDLTRRLAHTIKPTGGPAQLETIADAAQLIADLEQWRQARPYWDRCAECSCAPPRPAGRQICGGTRCVMVALEKT